MSSDCVQVLTSILRRGIFALLCCFLFFSTAFAQDLPQDEIQVNLNSYFDNFNVQIYYPTVALTKRFSDSSSVNLRYLVDVISAASMRSYFTVDGVTSATKSEQGGGDNKPDEVRQELAFGFNELLQGGVLKGGSVALNALYSREHDYASFTLAGSFSYLLAQKNTTLQLGMVRSWDRSFPQTRTWTRRKEVYSPSFTLTQALTPKMIAQVLLSYNRTSGYIGDPYQVVQIINGAQAQNFETNVPDLRVRKALGARLNYKLGAKTALNFGARYYWDSWQVNSFTTSLLVQRHLGKAATVGVGWRNYFQQRAYFFKPQYLAPELFMTVDTKLDQAYSNDYELKLTLHGGRSRLPVLSNENVQLNVFMNLYQRHSETPDWHSRYQELFAYVFSFGARYRF